MTRVKRGIISLKRRRNILRQTKGFHWGRKSKERAAEEALLHAGLHAFHDRRKKKRNFRKLWNIKINAASRARNLAYNKLIALLKRAHITLDRKILAHIAENHPAIFDAIVKKVA